MGSRKHVWLLFMISLLLLSGCTLQSSNETEASYTVIDLETSAANGPSAVNQPIESIDNSNQQRKRTLLPFPSSGKWGFVNRQGKFLIPAQYEQVDHFSEGRALVLLGENQYAFINEEGVRSEAVYYMAGPFSEDFAPVHEIGLSDANYINAEGNTLLTEINALSVKAFSEGLGAVTEDGTELTGYVDRTGKWSISPKYADALPFQDGYAAVNEKGLYGMIDTKGEYAIKPQFDQLQSYSEGMAPARISSRWGAIDMHGKMVILPNYTYLGPFVGGLAAAKLELNDKYGYIGNNGEWSIPPQFEEADRFHNGLAAVRMNGKYGFIDTKGQWAIQPIYDQICSPFMDDAALVRVGDDFKYIDREGNSQFE